MGIPEQNNYLSTLKQTMMNNALTTISILLVSIIATLITIAMYYAYIFSKYTKKNDNDK